MKLAFSNVKLEACSPQLIQDFAYVDFMLFKRVTVDKDIVDVRSAEVVQKLKQHVVDVVLKRARGVGKAKWHDKVFEQTEACSKRSKMFLAFFDSDPVKGGDNI